MKDAAAVPMARRFCFSRGYFLLTLVWQWSKTIHPSQMVLGLILGQRTIFIWRKNNVLYFGFLRVDSITESKIDDGSVANKSTRVPPAWPWGFKCQDTVGHCVHLCRPPGCQWGRTCVVTQSCLPDRTGSVSHLLVKDKKRQNHPPPLGLNVFNTHTDLSSSKMG